MAFWRLDLISKLLGTFFLGHRRVLAFESQKIIFLSGILPSENLSFPRFSAVADPFLTFQFALIPPILPESNLLELFLRL